MIKLKGTRVIAKGNVTGNYITLPCQIYNYIKLGLISHSDLAVYGYLFDRFNLEYGYAYPKIVDIMINTNIRTKRTVHKSIKNLEQVGLIEKGRSTKGNNVYRVYRPLEREELFKLIPGLVEEFEQHKENLLHIAKQDKDKIKIHWNSSF